MKENSLQREPVNQGFGQSLNYENVIIQLKNMRKTISIATVALSFCG